MKLSKAKNKVLKDKLKTKLPSNVIDTIMDEETPHNQNVKKLLNWLRGNKQNP